MSLLAVAICGDLQNGHVKGGGGAGPADGISVLMSRYLGS